MKPKQTSKERLGHIADAIQKIEIYTADVSEETFLENPMLHDAVLYQFTHLNFYWKSWMPCIRKTINPETS